MTPQPTTPAPWASFLVRGKVRETGAEFLFPGDVKKAEPHLTIYVALAEATYDTTTTRSRESLHEVGSKLVNAFAAMRRSSLRQGTLSWWSTFTVAANRAN